MEKPYFNVIIKEVILNLYNITIKIFQYFMKYLMTISPYKNSKIHSNNNGERVKKVIIFPKTPHSLLPVMFPNHSKF